MAVVEEKLPIITPKIETFENALEKVGSFHRYQAVVSVTYLLAYLCVGGNMLFMSFGNLIPTWRCPFDSNSTFGSDCTIYERCKEEIEFKSDAGFFSVVEDFGLVCDLSYVSSLMVSVQMTGVLIGALGGGQASDSFGRKPCLITVLVAQITLGIATASVESWQMFISLKFLIGIFSGAEIMISFTYVLEHFGQAYRLMIRPFGVSFFAQIWLSLLAYLIADWRTLIIVANAQSLTAIPLLLFAVSESPRWLLTHGKYRKFQQKMQRIAQVNRKPELTDSELEEVIKSTVHESSYGAIKSKPLSECLKESKRKRYSFWHLFGSRKLAQYSLVLGLCWFTSSAISYQINLDLKDFFGNPMLIQAALGAFGWLAVLFALFLDRTFEKVGRKFILTYSLAFPLVCFVIIIVYLLYWHETEGSKLNTFTTILVIVGESINQGAWMAEYQLSAELFPTVIRSISTGFCSGAARLGAILSPYIADLSKTWTPYSYVILACLTGLSLVLSFIFLDETKGKPLPEFLNDLEKEKEKKIDNTVLVF